MLGNLCKRSFSARTPRKLFNRGWSDSRVTNCSTISLRALRGRVGSVSIFVKVGSASTLTTWDNSAPTLSSALCSLARPSNALAYRLAAVVPGIVYLNKEILDKPTLVSRCQTRTEQVSRKAYRLLGHFSAQATTHFFNFTLGNQLGFGSYALGEPARFFQDTPLLTFCGFQRLGAQALPLSS